MSGFLGEPKRIDQPSPDMVERTGPASSSSPQEPISLERLAKAAQHLAQQGEGRTGPSSSSPLRDKTDTAEAWAREAKQKAMKAEKLANPTPERRGLPNDVKHRLVTSFACFQSLTTIRDWLKRDFGLTLDDRTILAYDCGRPDSRVGKRLKSLYLLARKQYVASSADMAVAHQAHRLKLIGVIVEKATTSKDYGAALKGLELAAKEMGGALEGKTVVEHKGTVAHVHGNIEDARAELAMRLQQVVDGGVLLPAPDVVDDL